MEEQLTRDILVSLCSQVLRENLNCTSCHIKDIKTKMSQKKDKGLVVGSLERQNHHSMLEDEIGQSSKP